MREATNLAYSEPSSPEHFNPTGYFDNHLHTSDSNSLPFSHNNGPSPPIPSYHPRYDNPAAASINSLQRTLIEAEAAVKRGEFDIEFEEQQADHFVGSSPYDEFPSADRARFSETVPQNLGGFAFTNGIYSDGRFAEPLLTQPLNLQEPQQTQGFSSYITIPENSQAPLPNSIPTFPSQLLGGQAGQEDLTPRPFQVQGFPEVKVESDLHSPPAGTDLRFKSPPPPADLASRRSKPRPANLGTSALRDKTSTGPKTANNTEAVKRLQGSPTAAMRRVASASGLNVLAGRIQKSSQLPQRSPLTRNFSLGATNFLEQNAQMLKQVPLRNRSWLSRPRGPPTPRSPRDMPQESIIQQDDGSQHDGQTPQDQNTPSSSSQSESDGGYSFDRTVPGCLTTHGLMTNMVSPPETPAHPHGLSHWSFDVPDDPLHTPAFTAFSADTFMQMPQPQYVSPLTGSQPPTPAFGQFNGFPYINQSPVFEMVGPHDMGTSEYFFSESGIPPYAIVASTKSPQDQPKEKTYTFNNATQKDFESA